MRNPGGLVVEVTDGTAEYNAENYRVNAFYDLAKTSVIRMAWGLAQELAGRGATAVALTPGWMRSELMLEHHSVSEANWRDATERTPHFCISESPRYVGRAVAALAGDPEVARWNGQSLSSGGLAQVYGFTDLDGTQARLLALHGRGSRRGTGPPATPATASGSPPRSRGPTCRCPCR